jgi:hypothetical protein
MVGKIIQGKKKKIDFVLFILIGLFLYNALKLLAVESCDLPIPSILFNLIIFLILIVIYLHKEGINKIDIQTTLDYYFKTNKTN